MDKFIAHILVVDDDDGIRSLVKKYLNENNFLVKIGRAHVRTPVTEKSRMPSSA